MWDFISRLRSKTEHPEDPDPESTVDPEVAEIIAKEKWEFDRLDEQPYEHYTDALDDVERFRREERHDEAEDVLLWCLDYAEAEAELREYGEPPQAYYRHLGIVYRKDDRHEDEVEVLERYVDACDRFGGEPRAELLERLERARELAAEPRS
ncbi:hypothetical protein [Natronococcus occultus]|uniref:Tetratricopeptide repeat protein n=1 Tax=Natronococcus occultus SP4 TaxID=694430 RepID=L0K6I8_9EURY|nr:hypothetical protein [Natronococcus occultus]AGB39974.1 hypothetical protein Natoc_4282 [Natronococcus occultus SP4]